MDVNSSLGRRYSFNLAQSNPVAESTHLNGSTSFCWGSSMSPKNRSNSSLCLNNTQETSLNKSIISPKTKNITKIDARIAADVQSKGLASRIVKYHESGTRLNRSMSAHNLYSKPGQFPAVTLKKMELPYRATKQELSMIRIPPPEKSSFYGNTISSLLRSSSVVGMQSKRSEDLSRENRPIIHPPPTENDMAPTRSVLDVLKEISRKRINSDDLDVDETSKKYCNRTGNDFVDIGGSNTSTIPANFLSSASCHQRYKRQRDCITPHQSLQLLEAKTSPEQAKKRICNYNNDITSSLSSSIKSKPNGNAKRISAKHNLNQTMPTDLESYATQRAKMQRYLDYNNKNNNHDDVRLKNLDSTLRKIDTINPITPIPLTPCAQDQSNGVPPMRTVSEPLYNRDGKITMHLIQPSNKPRLTLFNKKCDEDTNTEVIDTKECGKNNIGDLNDFDECAGIQFVKPKQISSISGLRNPVIERTQKSKLALMLSGLRGELYQNVNADELDSPKKNPAQIDDDKINTQTFNNAVTSALKSTSTITTLTTVTSSTNVGTLNSSSTLNLPSTTKTNITSILTPNTSPNKTSSPLVGLKLSQAKSSVETAPNTLASDTTRNTQRPSIPTLGGFSFGTTNTSSPSIKNSTALSSALKEDKTNTSLIPPIANSSVNMNNFALSNKLTLTSTPTLNKTNNLSANIETTAKDNAICVPSVSSSFSISTSDTTTLLKTSSSTATNAFTFETKTTAPSSTDNSQTENAVVSPFISTSKSNNDFNFTVPSTSASTNSACSAPIMFGTLSQSVGPEKTTLSTVVTTTTSPLTFGTPSTSSNIGGLTNTSSLSFNTPKPSTTSETTTSSSRGVASVSFNFGLKNNNTVIPTFGSNTNTAIEIQNPGSPFSFGSFAKTQLPTSTNQNKSVATNPITNNVFTANSSNMFGSTSSNASSTGSSAALFSNASTEQNMFNSANTTQIFGSSSVKAATPTFGSSVDKNPATVTAPPVFGGSSTNSPHAPFSFGSKPSDAPAANTNNTNNAGGFSFNSAISSNAGGGTFGFGNKTSGPANTSNNAFGGTSTSTSQNKNFSFGSTSNNQKVNNPPSVFGGAINKPTENTSSGGFSFGSAIPPKASTFSFGASGGSSFPGNNTNSNSTSAPGFSFGRAAPPKQNEINEPFSFGTSQPQLQQQISSNNMSSNIFGSSGVTKTAAPPAFNFNTGASNNMQSNAPTINNIFAPPAATAAPGPGDRPIRRATRRLQK